MLNEPPELITFSIREEELDILKEWIQSGEIDWHKEVFIEEKTFTVPVKREELIIEKKSGNAESENQSICMETIRIPVREERIEIKKHTFDLEEVKIDKHQIQQEELIKSVLKKEIFYLKTSENSDTKTFK